MSSDERMAQKAEATAALNEVIPELKTILLRFPPGWDNTTELNKALAERLKNLPKAERLAALKELRINHGWAVAISRDSERLLPPGRKLALIARSLLSPKDFKMFVEPVIADMQAEHAAAKDVGQSWRARWIHTRGYVLVIPGWLYAFFAGRLAKLFRHRTNR